MFYFSINGKFKPFKGEVESFCQAICGVSLPHQIIMSGKNKILLATDLQILSFENQKAQVGKSVSIEPKIRGADCARLIINPNPENFEGQVAAARTFSFGRNVFFANLLVNTGNEKYINLAFRPYPSEKRKMGMDLVGQKIIFEDGSVLYGGKKWPK
jgi:hypothetical protein